MRRIAQLVRSIPKAGLHLAAAAITLFPVAVAVGLVGYDIAPSRWLGGEDGFLIVAITVAVPILILIGAYAAFVHRHLFGHGRNRLAGIIVVAAMAAIGAVLIYGRNVIWIMHHFYGGTRVDAASECERGAFFTHIERCNGRSFGFIRVSWGAYIARGTPRLSLAEMSGNRPAPPKEQSNCQMPEAHHPAQCTAFGFPERMHCFACLRNERWLESSLLVYAPDGSTLIRVWTYGIATTEAQARPDRLDKYFDVTQYR
jgi:hypothetical protein